MARVALALFVAAISSLAATTSFAQQQTVDLDYDTTIARPAYAVEHPAVLFDEAHHNFHKADALYKPFVSLIANDGYRVAVNRKPFSEETLGEHHILVIANAEGDPDRANPAFSAGECQAVDAWVKEGGALLLITDHYEWGAAAQPLAKRLGIGMSQRETIDAQNSVPRNNATLIFARANELLGDHPIIWGRGPVEQINYVVTYSGQSLQGPRGSVAFLRLADTALDRSSVDNSLVPAAGRCQGLAFIHGKGRVVVLGDAGVLTAQFDKTGLPFGMNVDGTDNRQLALNIMHWLSGLIPVDRRAAARKPGASRRSSSSRAKSRTSKQEKAQDPPSD